MCVRMRYIKREGTATTGKQGHACKINPTGGGRERTVIVAGDGAAACDVLARAFPSFRSR